MKANTPTTPEPAEANIAVEPVPVAKTRKNVLPVVEIGDNDGWAQFAMRCIGASAETFEAHVAADLGVERIDDDVWAKILPEVKEGSKGLQVVLLKQLLGVGSGPKWDDEVAKALDVFCGATVCDAEAWEMLIARAASQ